MAKVFISHKSDDELAARRIALALQRAGHEPWLAEDHILVGESIVAAIQRGLSAADYVIVCLSQRALLSGWVEAELENTIWRQFSHRQERLLPVRLEAVPVPAIIGHLLYLDLFPDERWIPAVDRLLASIRAFEERRGRDVDAANSIDWLPYLSVVAVLNGYLNIAGIGSGAGRVRSATRYPIETLYTPLAVRGGTSELAGDGARPHAMEGGATPLQQLLSRHRLLIEGQPGAGKTTFVRLVASVLARDGQGIATADGVPWRQRHLGLEATAPARIPVLLKVAELVPVLQASPPSRVDDHRIVLDLLESLCAENDLSIGRDVWQALLDKGGAWLLFDGLDEVADQRLRERVFAVFRDTSTRWDACPIVVTSRPTQTHALREMGFYSTMVEPFGDGEIREFVNRWVGALHDVEPGDALAGSAERHGRELFSAIEGSAAIRYLATNPVMLTCLCVVHWNEGRLPRGRARAYRAVIRWLLAARSNLRAEEGFNDRFALRALARLALAMMTTAEGKRSLLDLETAAVAISPIVERQFPTLVDDEERRYRGRDFLRFECLGSGVIEEVRGNQVRFWHLTFQEFLAALQLSWRGDGDDRERDWWPLVRDRLDDPQWRETVELLPGVLLDEGGEGRVDRLLERVLKELGDEPTLAEEARIAGVMGQLLESLEAYDYAPPPRVQQDYDGLLRRAMAIFTRDGAEQVPVKTRIAAAEALGRGNDPRLRDGCDNFIAVPGTAILLGKYPVTVEEYQRFVERRGYEEQRFWDGEGWRFRQEQEWTAPDEWPQQLRAPNRPVVGVSWFEAMAYCRWLSEIRSVEVRLPHEKEWAAAASPDGRKYPWGGDEPNEQLANFAPDFHPNVGAPSPVGLYPAGDGPYEHCDLAGNVWEWSADERTDVDRSVDKRRESGPAIVLRGGCWDRSAGGLLAARRDWSDARLRTGFFGFRVAVVPASTVVDN